MSRLGPQSPSPEMFVRSNAFTEQWVDLTPRSITTASSGSIVHSSATADDVDEATTNRRLWASGSPTASSASSSANRLSHEGRGDSGGRGGSITSNPTILSSSRPATVRTTRHSSPFSQGPNPRPRVDPSHHLLSSQGQDQQQQRSIQVDRTAALVDDEQCLTQLFHALDMDDDGILSASDFYAFLALHPQACDEHVGNYCATQWRHGRSLLSVPLDGQWTLLSDFAPCRELDSQISTVALGEQHIFTSSRRTERHLLGGGDLLKRYLMPVDHAKAIEGPLWWIHQRLAQRKKQSEFVSFVFAMTYDSVMGDSKHPESVGASSVGTTSPPESHLIDLPGFISLYRRAHALLYSAEDSPSQATLNLPMLRTVHWFFEFLWMYVSLTGNLAVEGDGGEWKPRWPLRSCLPTAYWLLDAWLVPSVDETVLQPILQRLAEGSLRSLAKQNYRDRQQVVRHVEASLQLRSSPFAVSASRRLHSPHATAQSTAAPSTTEKLLFNLLVSQFLETLYTRPTWNLSRSNHATTIKQSSAESGHSEAVKGSTLLEDSVVKNRRQAAQRSLLRHDMALHVLVEPDGLSMTVALQYDERERMYAEQRWCIFRAVMIGLVAAVLIGVSSIAFQWLFLEEDPNFGANFITSGKYYLDELFVLVQVREERSYATPAPPLFSDPSSSWKQYLQFQISSLVVSVVVSIVELVLLHRDSVRVCFQMAYNAGVVLYVDESARSGSTSLNALFRGGGGDIESSESTERVRSTLSTRRTRFMLSAISRCVSELPFDSQTLFGADVRDRNVSTFYTALMAALGHLLRIGPTFFIRVLASKLLSPLFVPFVGTPVLMFWNAWLARHRVKKCQTIVVGAVHVERVTAQLLHASFSHPSRLIRHNSLERGSSVGTSLQLRGLSYVPYHVYREAMALVLFYCHVIDPDQTVHPALHCLLAYLASHIETPYKAVVLQPFTGRHAWEGPSSTLSSSSTPASALTPQPSFKLDGTGTTRSTNNERPQVAGDDTTLQDVGGNYGSSVLGGWLRTFLSRLNTSRRAFYGAARSECLQLLPELHPWDDVERKERLALQRHPRFYRLLHPVREAQAYYQFLLETAFPGWALWETPTIAMTVSSSSASGATSSNYSSSTQLPATTDVTRQDVGADNVSPFLRRRLRDSGVWTGAESQSNSTAMSSARRRGKPTSAVTSTRSMPQQRSVNDPFDEEPLQYPSSHQEGGEDGSPHLRHHHATSNNSSSELRAFSFEEVRFLCSIGVWCCILRQAPASSLAQETFLVHLLRSIRTLYHKTVVVNPDECHAAPSPAGVGSTTAATTEAEWCRLNSLREARFLKQAKDLIVQHGDGGVVTGEGILHLLQAHL